MSITEKYIKSFCKNRCNLKSSMLKELQPIEAKQYDYAKLDRYKDYNKKLSEAAKKILKKAKSSYSQRVR